MGNQFTGNPGRRGPVSVEAAQVLAGEDVEMEMVDGLTGQRAHVGDHAVALGDAQVLSQLGDDGVNMPHHRGGLLGHLGGGGQMDLGDHQKMDRSQGVDIIKGVAEVILIDLAAGDLPGDDLAEQAVVHGDSSFVFPHYTKVRGI